MDTNNLVLSGRLTKDFELATSQSGVVMAKSSLANNGRKDKVTFVNLVIFGKQAETIAKYTSKGSQLIVVGRLDVDSYEDKSGNKRTSVGMIVNDFTFIGAKVEAEPRQDVAPTAEDIYDAPVDLSESPF